jgi:hypothetical protein
MRRPEKVEREFAMLLALIGAPVAYAVLRGAFALIGIVLASL